MKMTRVSSNTRKTTQASHIASPFSLSGNTRNQTFEEVVDMKAWLGMIYVLYCYEKFKLSDNKYDCYFDRVEENGEHYMRYVLRIMNLV